jgi:RNA polymerase sigma-70 factor, ECF subfamily
VHEPGRRSSEPSDEVLAERVQRGDREALERLVMRYLRPIHAVTASYLSERADVEDAVQETFLRVLDRIATYQPARPFAPWLYQIARNVARDRITTNTRRGTEPLPDDSVAGTAADPELVLEQNEIRRHVATAIAELPEQQRTAFRLHDVEGYTTNEIARIMGLSPGTVRSHVHYARRALRRTLASVLREPRNAEDRW